MWQTWLCPSPSANGQDPCVNTNWCSNIANPAPNRSGICEYYLWYLRAPVPSVTPLPPSFRLKFFLALITANLSRSCYRLRTRCKWDALVQALLLGKHTNKPRPSLNAAQISSSSFRDFVLVYFRLFNGAVSTSHYRPTDLNQRIRQQLFKVEKWWYANDMRYPRN